MNGYGQDQERYLCGVEVAGEFGEPQKDSQVACSQSYSLNSSFQHQDLSCPGAGENMEPQLTGYLAQTALLPTATAVIALENSHVTANGAVASPSCPSTSDPLSSEGVGGSPSLCTLHVEVCQRPDSTLRCTRLKELVLSMLRQRGTAFGELLLQDFEDPVVKEHVQSVAITDVPQELKVRARQPVDWWLSTVLF